MSCFLFPRSLYEGIEKVVACFYLGLTLEDVKILWLSREKIARSKKMGGLGFHEMYYFNLAMVAKQYLRLARNGDSVTAKILKMGYYPRGNIESVIVGFQPSYLCIVF